MSIWRISVAAPGVLAIAAVAACSTQSRAQHFNEAAAEERSKAPQVVAALALERGDAVADLGAGGGYFSYLFAHQVGAEGRVYAVDIEPEYLTFIEQQRQARGLDNLHIVAAAFDDSKLPDRCCDLIFARDVYHHLQDRTAYFRRLGAKLRPGGRLAIIDYRAGGMMGCLGHGTDELEISRELSKAGYAQQQEHSFLEHQTFTVWTLRDE